MQRSAWMSAFVMVVAGLSGTAPAGELNPPMGPVSPTMKDLDDVEPRTAIRNDFDNLIPIVISSPGSYYLAENIDAFHGEHGIEITASNVSLDLNGFRIRGNLEVGSLDGIHVADGMTDITIRNGRIVGFGGAGIAAVSTVGARIESVDVRVTVTGGIVAGASATITNCTVESVTGMFSAGIVGGLNSTITGCRTTNCYTGVFALNRSKIDDCSALDSTFAGFYLGGDGMITDCLARGVPQQTQFGVYIEGPPSQSVVTRNHIREFSIAGVRTTSRTEISHNTIFGSDFGGDTAVIVTGPQNSIHSNTFQDVSNGVDYSGVCGQLVFANRLHNVGPLSVNDCGLTLVRESFHLSTNPHANLQ